MPGSVQNAVSATVLPQSLSVAFTHERAYPLIENEYKNGESQRSVQTANSRKRWRLTKRLAPGALQSLRNFYEARNGTTEDSTLPQSGQGLPPESLTFVRCDRPSLGNGVSRSL